MIARYARPAMRDIWTEQRKLEIWLKIELLATEALVEQGLVPLRDFRKMKKGAAFSIDRCKELERTLNHDVIAFTTNVAENINDKASRWLHYGLTSSDLIDTAFAVQMVESVDILHQDVIQLRKVIARKAKKHAFTPMIGRSHGIHAEPTTFGLKMALMFDEFGRAERRLEGISGKHVAIWKLSGAVGDQCPPFSQGRSCGLPAFGAQTSAHRDSGGSEGYPCRIHDGDRLGRCQH